VLKILPALDALVDGSCIQSLSRVLLAALFRAALAIFRLFIAVTLLAILAAHLYTVFFAGS
jgi:hypothetical protein